MVQLANGVSRGISGGSNCTETLKFIGSSEKACSHSFSLEDKPTTLELQSTRNACVLLS